MERALSKTLTNGARNVTESIGGLWQGLDQPEPKFIPLDEFIADKFLAEFNETEVDLSELVLEGGEIHG